MGGKTQLQHRMRFSTVGRWSLRRIGTQVFAVRILNVLNFSFFFFSFLLFFLELGSGLGLSFGLVLGLGLGFGLVYA